MATSLNTGTRDIPCSILFLCLAGEFQSLKYPLFWQNPHVLQRLYLVLCFAYSSNSPWIYAYTYYNICKLFCPVVFCVALSYAEIYRYDNFVPSVFENSI